MRRLTLFLPALAAILYCTAPSPSPGPREGGVDGVDAGGGLDSGEGGPAGDGGMDVDAGRPFVYVGSENGSISVYRFSEGDGGLSWQSSVVAGNNPSFLAFHPSGRWLFAVNESSSQVSAYSIDSRSGALTLLNRQPSAGSGPAHVSVDRGGKFVLVANYGSGHVGVLPIQPDGGLSASVQTLKAGNNAHQIITDAANAHVFVPCLGSDYIAQYTFNASNGALGANAVPTIATASEAGPRHLAFHPNRPLAYGLNELSSTMNTYSYAPATGRLTALGPAVSTLPSSDAGVSNTGAEVWVHPSGKYVFASNRGHNSIAVFAVDSVTGQLSLRGNTSTGGVRPRSFDGAPNGRILLVANHDSNNITALSFDEDSGALTLLGPVAQLASPQFVGIVYLP